jgi:hypothetical protein
MTTQVTWGLKDLTVSKCYSEVGQLNIYKETIRLNMKVDCISNKTAEVF